MKKKNYTFEIIINDCKYIYKINNTKWKKKTESYLMESLF